MFFVKNHGLLKSIALRLVNKAQKILLKIDTGIDIGEGKASKATELYYFLAKLHFKLHFGTSLEEEILNNTENAHLAVKRHSRLVLMVLFPDASEMRKKVIRHAARGAFRKNLILNAKV